MSETRQYELVYVVSPEITEEGVTELHERIAEIVGQLGGSIDKTDNWGRRRLAYEIDRHREGTYVIELITGPGTLVTELGRRLRVMEQLLRHLIVRVDEDLRKARRARERRQSRQQRRLAKRPLGDLEATAQSAATAAPGTAAAAAPESAAAAAPEPAAAAAPESAPTATPESAPTATPEPAPAVAVAATPAAPAAAEAPAPVATEPAAAASESAPESAAAAASESAPESAATAPSESVPAARPDKAEESDE